MIETVIITNKSNVDYLKREMNVKGQTLISQQCSSYSNLPKLVYNCGSERKVVSNTKGIGTNRNIALNYSIGDVCVLADDDMIFFENYHDIVRKAYSQLPNADLIIFDIEGKPKLNMRSNKPSKVNKYNYMRLGAARFTFRRESIGKYGLSFNEYFGASTFGSGEDTLFLKDCLTKGLNLYYYPKSLARLSNKRESSWFKGYDEEYYFDKGALYYVISPKLYKLLLIRHIFKMRKRHSKKTSNYALYKAGINGANYFKSIGRVYDL